MIANIDTDTTTTPVTLDNYTGRALGVAYGLGVDSTAMLVGMVARGIRPDFILFADVGAEKQATYDFLPIMQRYLAADHLADKGEALDLETDSHAMTVDNL